RVNSLRRTTFSVSTKRTRRGESEVHSSKRPGRPAFQVRGAWTDLLEISSLPERLHEGLSRGGRRSFAASSSDEDDKARLTRSNRRSKDRHTDRSGPGSIVPRCVRYRPAHAGTGRRPESIRDACLTRLLSGSPRGQVWRSSAFSPAGTD